MEKESKVHVPSDLKKRVPMSEISKKNHGGGEKKGGGRGFLENLDKEQRKKSVAWTHRCRK